MPLRFGPVAPAELPIQIDFCRGGTLDFQVAGTYVTNEFRIIGIQAAFVLADDGGHLEPGHRLDQEHIQEPVTGVRVRRRVESAAIPAAVAGKNQGELSLQYFSVQCDAVGPVDALDDVGQSGKPIGAGACDRGKCLYREASVQCGHPSPWSRHLKHSRRYRKSG